MKLPWTRKPYVKQWYDSPPPGAIEGIHYSGRIVSWAAIYYVQGFDLNGPPPWEAREP